MASIFEQLKEEQSRRSAEVQKARCHAASATEIEREIARIMSIQARSGKEANSKQDK